MTRGGRALNRRTLSHCVDAARCAAEATRNETAPTAEATPRVSQVLWQQLQEPQQHQVQPLQEQVQPQQEQAQPLHNQVMQILTDKPLQEPFQQQLALTH